MTLNARSSYPSQRSYVLKLHRDASPSRIVGRLEHMDSGRCFDFSSTEELLARLMEDMRLSVRQQDDLAQPEGELAGTTSTKGS